MKYSKTLQWFLNVKWDDQKCFIDCLVDIANVELSLGYYLVEVEGLLNIHEAKQDESQVTNKFLVIGEVKRRIISL